MLALSLPSCAGVASVALHQACHPKTEQDQKPPAQHTQRWSAGTQTSCRYAHDLDCVKGQQTRLQQMSADERASARNEAMQSNTVIMST